MLVWEGSLYKNCRMLRILYRYPLLGVCLCSDLLRPSLKATLYVFTLVFSMNFTKFVVASKKDSCDFDIG